MFRGLGLRVKTAQANRACSLRAAISMAAAATWRIRFQADKKPTTNEDRRDFESNSPSVVVVVVCLRI